VTELDRTEAVDRALTWLAANQTPAGELRAWASPLDDGPPTWVPDTLNFITALAAIALDRVEHAAATTVVDRAVDFLIREQQPNGLWRYWAADNDQSDFTPADADDTACAALAVAGRGFRWAPTERLLLANRNDDGRFWTWFVDRPAVGTRSLARALRDERRAVVRQRRAELWETTEADANDVDVVVNANVCRYLGAGAPDAAADWVVQVLRDGRDVGEDKWHRRASTLHLSIADGARRGVGPFRSVAPVLTERIERRWERGELASALDQAQSLLALQAIDAPRTVRGDLVDALLRSQRPDGDWERSIFYFGGPREVFGWASEALSTAYAAAALAGEPDR
jgi:hypothetical protein